MANEFSKEERVSFDEVLQGFNDALSMVSHIKKYNTDQTQMERSNDVIWRPMPYIAQSYTGSDATGNFGDNIQLSVPASINTQKHSTATLSATELRDLLQENRLGDAATEKLASDINVSALSVASLQGTLVVKRTAAASGYDDMAECDSLMREQGIMSRDRYAALTSRDYNNMASNLSTASRSFGNAKSDRAYEDNYVGRVSEFETYKLDYSRRIAAAAGGGGLTIDTQASANNYYVPKATSVSATGEESNVDNRYQTVTISSTTNVVAGDCFTIAGVNAVHHITKDDTGSLKTFRVISVDSATTMTISPAIVSNQGGSDAEAQYQNCTVTASATAAIVFLNTVAANANCFWHRDAIELLPGRLAVPADAGAAVMRATTDAGIEVVMQKQFDINTQKTFYRWDVLYGVVNLQPEMSGIMLFSQT